jgi:molybdenum cofactor biosynthesis protein MoaC
LRWDGASNKTTKHMLPEDGSVRGKVKFMATSKPGMEIVGFAPIFIRNYSTRAQPPHRLDEERVMENDASASSSELKATASTSTTPSLPHLTSSGTVHMVSVASKSHTLRSAIAVGTVYFSNATPLSLIRSNSLKKGDVLSVSRIAGIMAAKKCPDFVPLCHPIMLTHVGVELSVFDAKDNGFGGVTVEVKVQCEGQTGVEMEALTAVMGSALSVVDMCKAVDKGMRIDGVRVVLKEGGRSGVWKEEGWRSARETT